VQRLGVLALTLAACGASTGGPTLGDPCDGENPCNSGEICDFTAEGGPICITGQGDLDGDGIPNAMDFCQHQMGGAADEDRDGIGDDCDRCPIAAPRATPDADNDNVDSPCDPDPREPGDEILLFEGFSSTALDTRWKATTASVWKVQGGEVIATAPAAAAQDYLTTLVVAKANISIEASYRIDRIDSAGTPVQHIVALYMSDPRPAGVASMSCGVTKADGGAGELVLIETNQSAMNQLVSGAFDSANLYRAGGYVTGNRAACSVIANNTPLGTVQASITPDQLSSISLTAKAATARFQYVLVVGR
jgi:hypothetical protein